MGIAHLFEIQQEHWNIAVRLYAMPEYRRAAILGGTYFFTVVTHERQPFLTNPSVPDILGTIIDDVGLTYPASLKGTDARQLFPLLCILFPVLFFTHS